jgi:hypothetical protein
MLTASYEAEGATLPAVSNSHVREVFCSLSQTILALTAGWSADSSGDPPTLPEATHGTAKVALMPVVGMRPKTRLGQAGAWLVPGTVRFPALDVSSHCGEGGSQAVSQGAGGGRMHLPTGALVYSKAHRMTWLRMSLCKTMLAKGLTGCIAACIHPCPGAAGAQRPCMTLTMLGDES